MVRMGPKLPQARRGVRALLPALVKVARADAHAVDPAPFDVSNVPTETAGTGVTLGRADCSEAPLAPDRRVRDQRLPRVTLRDHAHPMSVHGDEANLTVVPF